MTIKQFRNYIIPFLLLSFQTSCGLFESTSDVIVGHFNVSFVDDVTWRSICYDNGTIVEPYVYAVGHNDKFIVAKQHPCERNEFKVNTSVTKYFIIEISKVDFKNGVYGPLEKNQFDSLSLSLNIGEIVFNMNYPEQPHIFAR